MIKLVSGFEMPALGFGTSGIEYTDVFFEAIKNGYRHFDTATLYENEQFVGEAMARAIQEGIVKREDLFICTKLWHTDYSDPEGALRTSLNKL